VKEAGDPKKRLKQGKFVRYYQVGREVCAVLSGGSDGKYFKVTIPTKGAYQHIVYTVCFLYRISSAV
jgi:hypothetical protein